MKALLLLLFPLGAMAHDHAVPVTTPEGKPAVTVVKPGEDIDHAKAHAIPLGNGASADGMAWLHVFVPGMYRILNAPINMDSTGKPVMLVPNRLYLIYAHKGPLIWVRPDGVQEKVPDANLIAVRRP